MSEGVNKKGRKRQFGTFCPQSTNVLVQSMYAAVRPSNVGVQKRDDDDDGQQCRAEQRHLLFLLLHLNDDDRVRNNDDHRHHHHHHQLFSPLDWKIIFKGENSKKAPDF